MWWAYDLKKPGSILMAGDDGGRGQSLDVAGCMSVVLQSMEPDWRSYESRSVEAAWRREKDGCQLSAYLGVSHKASSTPQGQRAEGSACGSVLTLDSAEVAWSFLCIDAGRCSLVSMSMC